MPRTYECSFCGHTFPQGRGMMYVKNDGTIYWFCSSRCRKAMIIFKKDPRKLKWTERYAKPS
ncbi:MAG: 50S ribosomal protein L24e [Candidatus Bathyarchaeota archaeon]|nr:50S ribosomal protein L24e [Candidatus Bathyarchaeota archaeon]